MIGGDSSDMDRRWAEGLMWADLEGRIDIGTSVENSNWKFKMDCGVGGNMIIVLSGVILTNQIQARYVSEALSKF